MKQYLNIAIPLLALGLIGVGGWLFHPGLGLGLVGALVWLDLNLTGIRR